MTTNEPTKERTRNTRQRKRKEGVERTLLTPAGRVRKEMRIFSTFPVITLPSSFPPPLPSRSTFSFPLLPYPFLLTPFLSLLVPFSFLLAVLLPPPSSLLLPLPSHSSLLLPSSSLLSPSFFLPPLSSFLLPLFSSLLSCPSFFLPPPSFLGAPYPLLGIVTRSPNANMTLKRISKEGGSRPCGGALGSGQPTMCVLWCWLGGGGGG